jgi:23S rRNA (cytidine1920-2'-O)/16S rRNA (cytidine1409-2'-O)-methyltransferase
MGARRRLDAELVRRGLLPSREQARQAVADGRVLVGGAPASKPDRMVDAGEPVVVVGPPPRYVSRGGLKLEAALDRFGIDPHGSRAIDVGSSTGGFTDCLLQRGAVAVVALDVGRNQLHERLRADARVDVREQTNVRHVSPGDVGGPAPLVVADLSFISLRTVLEPLLELVASGGRLVALVKPQFEAGRAEASKGRGVITDPLVWRRVLGDLRDDLVSHGAAMMGIMVSPITGADGNVEFLVDVAPGTPSSAVDDAALDAIVAESSVLVRDRVAGTARSRTRTEKDDQ